MSNFLLSSWFFLTSLMQGISWFWNAIGNNAFLTRFLDISIVSPLVACISLLLNITMLSRQNNLSHHPELQSLLLWSFLGIPFGIVLLQFVPHQQAISIITILLILLFCLQIYSQYNRIQLPSRLERVVCFFSWLFWFAYNVSGLFIALYVLSINLEKQRSIRLTATYFMVMNIISCLIFWQKWYITNQVIQYFMLAAPWVILWWLTWTYINKYIPQYIFIRLIRGFLLLSIFLMIF
jgi:uncharacterized protein